MTRNISNLRSVETLQTVLSTPKLTTSSRTIVMLSTRPMLHSNKNGAKRRTCGGYPMYAFYVKGTLHGFGQSKVSSGSSIL